MIKREFDKVSFVIFKFSANGALSLCLYWVTAASIKLPSSNTCTKAYFLLNLHVGCRCAPCAFMLRPGLKEQPLTEMYGPGRGGRKRYLGKPQMALKLLGASMMSLLLTFLWPKEVTGPNLVSVDPGSKLLLPPQRGTSGPIAVIYKSFKEGRCKESRSIIPFITMGCFVFRWFNKV